MNFFISHNNGNSEKVECELNPASISTEVTEHFKEGERMGKVSWDY